MGLFRRAALVMAVIAAQLLQAASKEEHCQAEMSPKMEVDANLLLQKHSQMKKSVTGTRPHYSLDVPKVELLAGRSEGKGNVTQSRAGLNYSSSTTFCYERDSSQLGNCWASKPDSSTTPACTADSGTTLCRCSNTACDVDALDRDPPTTGRCEQKEIYVPGGEEHTSSSGAHDVTGSGEEVYCKAMVKNDQWSQLHLVKLPSDPPAQSGASYWRCWPPYTWRRGACQRRSRYLGETCWGGRSGRGHCAGSQSSYDEYSTSCYQGTCIPYAWAQERQECSCAWLGWNFLVVCSAADDACHGHACVLNTGDGKKYCDYATGQDW